MHVSNYRLITLLNCDYKFVSKEVDIKLYDLLLKLVNAVLNDFATGRSIKENVRLMIDTIDYANCKKVSGAVLSANFYKAFNL